MSLLSFNLRRLFAYVICFKLLSFGILFPGLILLITSIFKWSGYKYLTAENLGRFLRNPIAAAGLFLVLLILVIYFIVDYSGVVLIIHASYHHQKISMFRAFFMSLLKVSEICRSRKKILFLVIMMLQIPFFIISLLPGLYNSIPSARKLVSRIYSRHLVIPLVLILLLILIRWFFAFHCFMAEGTDFRESIRRSAYLIKGRKVLYAFIFLLSQLLAYLIYIAFLAVAITSLMLADRYFPSISQYSSQPTPAILTLITTSLFLLASFGMPLSYVCISVLYYHRRFSLEEEIEPLVVPRQEREAEAIVKPRSQLYKTFEISLMIFALVLCIIHIKNIHDGTYNPDIEYFHITEVTAHRGSSSMYPENTMSAFRGAAARGADWIELDIHQSKDGVLFVMHDTSFKRTTGKKKNAWQLTWEEIQELDAGKYFSKEYKGEKIPSLEEVIAFALENNLHLNIEIKPGKNEKGLEENLVNLLHEMNYADKCVVTSQKYESITKVKKLDESIRTVYVMGFAYGSVTSLKYADDFSIRYIYVTDDLVRRIHNAGGRIYAWTLNNDYSINRMLHLQVDNIITDDVVLAQQCIREYQTTDIIYQYIAWFNTSIIKR